MGQSWRLSIIVLLSIFFKLVLSSRPIYDHQNVTYTSKFRPISTTQTQTSLSAYFSPDHSISTMVKLIQQAQVSITISIPGFSSWIGCTYPQPGDKCIGCEASKLIEHEKFPIFAALNNAIQRGVAVRIMTNDYEDEMCSGRMDLLTYLQIAGADVRFFTTLSFTHSKYMMIDSKILTLSSINYSKTSIMENREAGIIIKDNAQLIDFASSVFDFDFNLSYVKPIPPYPQCDIDLIHDTKHINVDIPDPYHFEHCNVTSPSPEFISNQMDVSLITSPDYSYEAIMEFKNAKSSLSVSIYQITDTGICDELIDMKTKNPSLNLRLFVSDEIYDEADYKEAVRCYNRLFSNGIRVTLSHRRCLRFSHQKFWIIDESVMFMSTGNWSPTDYPSGSQVFPPYGQSGWRKTNRDYTIRIGKGGEKVIKKFQDVFELDFSQGYEYSPSSQGVSIRLASQFASRRE